MSFCLILTACNLLSYLEYFPHLVAQCKLAQHLVPEGQLWVVCQIAGTLSWFVALGHMCGPLLWLQVQSTLSPGITSSARCGLLDSSSSSFWSTVCPSVPLSLGCFVRFGRRISIEIDFVLCSLKFYVHKVYFDLLSFVVVVVVVSTLSTSLSQSSSSAPASSSSTSL